MDRQNRPCAHCRPMQAISPLPVAVMSVLNLPQSCNSKLKKGTVYTPHSPSSLTDSPTCALGKIAKTCNTDCVTTCSSSRDDCPTITECVPGCFCQQGTVEFEDICLAEEQCPAEPSLLQYLPSFLFYCSSCFSPFLPLLFGSLCSSSPLAIYSSLFTFCMALPIMFYLLNSS